MTYIPKKNRVVAQVKTVPAWMRPVIVPDVTKPEDWSVVKLPNGHPAYIESKFLKK